MSARRVPGMLLETLGRWRAHKASRLAAALAYYGLFSLAPLLVVALAGAGRIYGAEQSREHLVDQLTEVVGAEAAAAVETLVTQASKASDAGIIMGLVGVFVLFIGGAGVFRNLKDALNIIWDVPPTEFDGGLATAWGFVRTQLLAVAMVLSVSVLLVLSVVAGSLISALAGLADTVLPLSPVALQLADVALSMVLSTAIFSLTFRVLPDRSISWGEVWLGATVTSVLFTLGRLGISIYLGIAGPASIPGAVGSLLVLLVWVYYSAQIYLLGAEFTFVYATRYRHGARDRGPDLDGHGRPV